MAGKNRTTVNFSSKKLKDAIAKIAADEHTSLSKAIEKLITFRIFEGNGDPVIDAFSEASKVVIGQQKKDDGEFNIALNTPYLKHAARLYMVSGHLSEKDSVTIDQKNIDKLDTVQVEKEIKRVIDDRIKKITPHEWLRHFSNEMLVFADLLLIFINKIKVEYKYEELTAGRGVLEINYSARNIRCIPFSFNKHDSLSEKYCNAMEHLDFDSVEHRSFRSVAIKGWNRNKHSHLLYIHQASTSDKGGFFIGVQYEKNDKKFSSQSPYSPPEVLGHTDKKTSVTESIYTRYSDINPELKVNIHHEPNSYEMRNLKPTLESEIGK